MVKILTDSSADLGADGFAKLEIEVIPIQVHFGDESYTPNINLTYEEFYTKLEKTDKIPTTTQVSPVLFEEYFTKCIENGDEVVGMFISKELSGTFQNAVLNAQKINPDKIHIVDTKNTTFGLGLLLQIAADFRDKGFSGKEIKQKVEDLAPRLCLFAVIDTLKYLKMGGRLSAGSAIVAGMLGISPIIAVVDGKICAIGKARGKQACFDFIDKKIDEVGVSADYPISLGHSNSLFALKQGEKRFSDILSKKKIIKAVIGPVVGAHIGPGAFGIAFIKK